MQRANLNYEVVQRSLFSTKFNSLMLQLI